MAERVDPLYENLIKKEKEIEENAYEYYCNNTQSNEDTDYEELRLNVEELNKELKQQYELECEYIADEIYLAEIRYLYEDDRWGGDLYDQSW
jgi:hypothetical protein